MNTYPTYPYAALAATIRDPALRDRFAAVAHMFARREVPEEIFRKAVRGGVPPKAAQ